MIAIASDHGGYALRQEIMEHLKEKGESFQDFGCENAESCDYPDYAASACAAVQSGACSAAILICGTGIGISIAANKMRGMRAALCTDTFMARLSRQHNDANALCLGARVIGSGPAVDIVDTFLSTEFEGGRHARRLEKITALEAGQKE